MDENQEERDVKKTSKFKLGMAIVVIICTITSISFYFILWDNTEYDLIEIGIAGGLLRDEEGTLFLMDIERLTVIISGHQLEFRDVPGDFDGPKYTSEIKLSLQKHKISISYEEVSLHKTETIDVDKDDIYLISISERTIRIYENPVYY